MCVQRFCEKVALWVLGTGTTERLSPSEVSRIRKCVSNVTYIRNKLFYIWKVFYVWNVEIKLYESHFATFETTFDTHFLIGETSGGRGKLTNDRSHCRDDHNFLRGVAKQDAFCWLRGWHCHYQLGHQVVYHLASIIWTRLQIVSCLVQELSRFKRVHIVYSVFREWSNLLENSESVDALLDDIVLSLSRWRFI